MRLAKHPRAISFFDMALMATINFDFRSRARYTFAVSDTLGYKSTESSGSNFHSDFKIVDGPCSFREESRKEDTWFA